MLVKKNLFKSNSLKVNAIFNALYQVLAILAPVITTPYVSRVFGSSLMGDYNYYYSILGYFTMIAAYGFTDYGTKMIAENRDDINKKSEIFWGIMTSKFLLSCFSLLIYLIISLVLFRGNSTAIYIFLGMSIYIISTMIDPVFYFQGEEDFVSISIRNMVMRALTITLTFVLVKDPSDLLIYTLVLSIGNLFATFIIFFSFKKNPIKRVSLNKLRIFYYLKSAFPFFMPALTSSLFIYLNQTMIGILADSTQSGYYAQSMKIITALGALAGSLSIIMSSRISYLTAKNNTKEIEKKIFQTFRCFFCVSIPLTFGLIAVCKELIPLFLGNDFIEAIPITLILSFVVIISPFNSLYSAIYYRPNNKVWIQVIILFIASLINIILCFILIPKYQGIGVSFARLGAEIIQIPFLMYFAKDRISRKSVLKSFIKPFDSGLIMLIGVYLFNRLFTIFFHKTWLLFVCEVLVGAIIYFVLEILFKDQFVMDMLNLVLKKVKSFLKKANK